MSPMRAPIAIRRLRRGLGAVLIATALTACGVGAGSAPSTSTAQSTSTAASTAESVAGGLFDDGSVHQVSVEFDEADYAELLAAYAADREKIWIEATVTIDGVTYQQAGLRLKGNSSLFSLRNADAATTEAQTLPWLVRLDKYVDGQDHQGAREFVIRSNSSQSALNELVALQLLGATGLATEAAANIRLSVNGSDEVLRLVIENPNDDWDDANFDGDGILYKAESGGDYSYRGSDPAAYEDVFDQETNTDAEDLTPLIGFLQFVNDSDDATFAAELDDHLDIEAFATYLAFEDLIDNFDDIDGPGNNSYLRYDAETGRFTVVAWDHNLAFGVQNIAGGPGGGRGGPGGAPAGGQMPTTGEAPTGGQMPGGGPNSTPNPLVLRFMANADFAALVSEAKAELEAELFDSGLADQLVADAVATLEAGATDLVDKATIEREAAAITAYVS